MRLWESPGGSFSTERTRVVYVCFSIVSAVSLHLALAYTVSISLFTSPVILISLFVGVLLLWTIVNRGLKRVLGVSYSAFAFVFFNVVLMCIFYVCFLWNAFGLAMDAVFQLQCVTLTIGLWRIICSDPGYLKFSNESANDSDWSISLQNHSAYMDVNSQASHGDLENLSSLPPRLIVRAAYCKRCKAYVKRFDHHCPAFGNCIGQGNHKLFMILLMLFISSELCYTLCGVSSLSKFTKTLNTNFMVSQSTPWIASTTLFSVLQLLWQVPFLLWHVYCICVNITTHEWVNWERYPIFQRGSLSKPGHLSAGRSFTNPYNRGAILNILEFLQLKAQ